MENLIVCPNCKKMISNNDIINDAAKGEGLTKRHMVCDCGEKITYWQITAQLRDQKTFGKKFHNWVQALSHRQSS
jgi:hypothetical protein